MVTKKLNGKSINTYELNEYIESNPESNVCDALDNWADWKLKERIGDWTIEVHASEVRSFDKGFSCEEIVLTRSIYDQCYVLVDADASDAREFVETFDND